MGANLSDERKRKNYSPNKKFNDLTPQNLSTGLISGTLAMTGPPVIILDAAAAGHLSAEQTISWMFAVYFFGGLFSIVLPMVYKIPITGAHSISGVAFLVTVAPMFTFPELIGGYMMTGMIIFLIGLTGVFSKLMKWVPKEIISAMLAGMITPYVVNLILSVETIPFVAMPAVISFFIFVKWIKRIPAVIGAVVVACIALFLTNNVDFSLAESTFAFPIITIPEFSILSLISVAIPLALLILSNDAAPGIGVLEKYNYDSPTNKIISISGITTICAAFFGGQSANVAGMMTAICADHESGEKHKRYMASVVSGVAIMVFGIFAWQFVPFISSLPKAFVMMLAGFALLSVLTSSLKVGFSSEKYRFSALFTYIITLSDVSMFLISAPVWALIVGTLIAKLLEKGDG